jgi:hypothetical protein
MVAFRAGEFAKKAIRRDWNMTNLTLTLLHKPCCIVPKYRKKVRYGRLRKEIGGIFSEYLQVKRNFTGCHF